MNRLRTCNCWLGLAASFAAVLAGCNLANKPPAGQSDYTILLHTFSGPSHISQAKYYKQSTEQLAKWKDLFIVHGDGRSELYWGKYRSHKASRGNLKKAKNWVTPAGIGPFKKAIVVPLPGSDIGPPEWNLQNADGAYTVVVATFYDEPKADYYGRKRFAVMYCRQLRDKGEEAYYNHGPSQSTVTVGSFPDSAVQMVKEGSRVKPVIHDPRIEAVKRRYPFLAVNGRKITVTIINKQGEAERVFAKSEPVHIPKKKKQNDTDSLDRTSQPQPR
ncbi:MAG: hypothetical protein SVT52_04490 [Planctomycetota bacterium]|nr:hypothetical protein [Planctomycetota bacterium]